MEAVEAGQADVIVAAYFDRLVRSLRVQSEVVQRVERAGGSVLALDVGQVTEATAGQWLSGTMLGAVSEYQRRTSAERSADAQRRAVERGVVPWPNIPPGYRRGEDGVLVPYSPEVPHAVEAFRLRVEGESVKAVRAYLIANGIERTWHGVQVMLKSRLYLGEIHFGKLVNTHAHKPIIDPETFRRVQQMTVPRGRRASSDRLLARLGVLRCESCGARMIVGTQTQHGRSYPFYRCPPTGDCTRRVTISAELVESAISDRVRAALADIDGRASAEASAREAEVALEDAQQKLDAAIRTLDGFDEPAARERLIELRQMRDHAQARVDELGGGAPSKALTINAAADWDRLTSAEQRALIRATVERATVGSGRGLERLTVKLFTE